ADHLAQLQAGDESRLDAAEARFRSAVEIADAPRARKPLILERIAQAAGIRILYGVVGEGMGHAIRSRVVLDELVKKHEVQVVVSGRAHDYLAKRASEQLQVRKIWGFTIVTEDNEVRNLRTLLANLKGAFTGGWPKNIKAYF